MYNPQEVTRRINQARNAIKDNPTRLSSAARAIAQTRRQGRSGVTTRALLGLQASFLAKRNNLLEMGDQEMMYNRYRTKPNTYTPPQHRMPGTRDSLGRHAAYRLKKAKAGAPDAARRTLGGIKNIAQSVGYSLALSAGMNYLANMGKEKEGKNREQRSPHHYYHPHMSGSN